MELEKVVSHKIQTKARSQRMSSANWADKMSYHSRIGWQTFKVVFVGCERQGIICVLSFRLTNIFYVSWKGDVKSTQMMSVNS